MEHAARVYRSIPDTPVKSKNHQRAIDWCSASAFTFGRSRAARAPARAASTAANTKYIELPRLWGKKSNTRSINTPVIAGPSAVPRTMNAASRKRIDPRWRVPKISDQKVAIMVTCIPTAAPIRVMPRLQPQAPCDRSKVARISPAKTEMKKVWPKLEAKVAGTPRPARARWPAGKLRRPRIPRFSARSRRSA